MDEKQTFTFAILERYIARLPKADDSDDDPKATKNVKNHMHKLLESLGFQPDRDLRELVPIMERMLPVDDGANGLVDGIVQNNGKAYSCSSKNIVLQSLARVLSIKDVRDYLFGDDDEHANRVMDLIQTRRKAYQNVAKNESRANTKNKKPPPPPSSSASSTASPAHSVSDERVPDDDHDDDDADHGTQEPVSLLDAPMPCSELVKDDVIDQQTRYSSNLERRVAALERMIETFLRENAVVQLDERRALSRLVQVHCKSLEMSSDASVNPTCSRV
jgi:hypothetical protein